MSISEPHRQAEIAETLEQTARTLAHSTRDVPAPFDSYRLLGELAPTLDHLEQACRQLADWHRQVIDGQHYGGEDERGDGATGTIEAAAQLENAAAALAQASDAVRAAHEANSVVRWIGQ